MRYVDLTGARFGKLVVSGYVGASERGQALWKCACDCGGEKIAAADNLKRGRTQSCGCLARAQREAAARTRCHDFSKAAKPREHSAWSGMLRRCYSEKHPSFIRYGARGIGVCDRWRESFARFYADMGDAPTGGWLDRINNDRDYSPDNCRWATAKEQANNRRNNRLLTFNGETMNVQQWSDRLGWSKSIIASRLHYGWSVERILTEAPRKRHRAA